MIKPIVEVLLPIPVNHSFSYITDIPNIVVGSYVMVPFRTKIALGVIIDISFTHNKNLTALKEIQTIINLPPIKKSLINFIKWVANYNVIPIGLLLKMVISNVITVKNYKNLIYDHFCINNNSNPGNCYKLSQEQQLAADNIINKLNKYNTILLDGETGSGKTEVYCYVIAYLLKFTKSAQVLILLPEIILTNQLLQRLNLYFAGFNIVQWHSSLTNKKRKETWLEIVYGNANIIIGARSALFLPYKNLKLIIIDEEHDTSFKQEHSVIYNARDMAIVLAKEENIPIVLCSATPSLETISNITKKNYQHLKLYNRFGNATLPDVQVIDMCKSKLIKKWLSIELFNKIVETVKAKYQVMLFLNRRGYAQLMLCSNCGFKVQCPNCSILLAYHKNKNLLICHYCNYSTKVPNFCKNCHNESTFVLCGIGIEKLAEQLSELIPNANIAILSSDVTQKSVAKIISEILAEKVNIIIGTQIIAKGHNFPKLNLVGVIDADSGLENCDLRATEKTYQLLHQVAGRSGRFEKKGKVILQTYSSESIITKALVNFDRKLFYDQELKSRFLAKMPPYSKLIALIISGKQESLILETARNIVKSLYQLQFNNLIILGPVIAPIGILNKNYRYRILLKIFNDYSSITKSVVNCIKDNDNNKNIKIVIDIDPINFM